MSNSVRYYRSVTEAESVIDVDRFPRNHVRYPAKFKPLEWINNLQVRAGWGPLSLERGVLAAYDSAAPFDRCLGTPAELKKVRSLVRLLNRGLDQNPDLLGIGRLLLKKLMVDRLKARRAVLRHYHENKVFIDAHGKLNTPLIITGLPRTGSTLLQRLLAQDPNARSPLTYEMETPLPPLADGRNPWTDPRVIKANNVLQVLTRTAPGFIEKFSESHQWSATEYEESYIYMLAHNGLLVLDAPNAGEDYTRELAEADYHSPVLRYERIFFTTLDAYRPAKSHWVLKAPNYAPALPHLLEEYPDARIVLTHRNPLITLPSVCRLIESWCVAFVRDGSFDKHAFAKLVSKLLIPCFSVPFEYRRAHPEPRGRIFDCMYDELFADPIAMVKRIYAWSNLEVTVAFEQAMRKYLDTNRQGRYGQHRYSLAEYGIDGKDFQQRYSDYMNHYGFTLEGALQPRRAGILPDVKNPADLPRSAVSG